MTQTTSVLAKVAAASGVALIAAVVLRHHRRRRRAFLPEAAHARKQAFLRRAAGAYGYRCSAEGFIDWWRARELPGLIAPLGHRNERGAIVYLDNAGGALPTASQLSDILQAAGDAVVGNPHSTGPAAAAGAAAMESARHLVLEHFCGERACEWELVWTSGATSALRAAAEAFPFSPQRSHLLFTHNAHTSVLGMRLLAAAAGASWTCCPLGDLQTAADAWRSQHETGENVGPQGRDCPQASWSNSTTHHHLAVIPLECNLTGDRVAARSAVSAIMAGQVAGMPSDGGQWWVMLDAAKAAATSVVDVPATGAAMCCVSLYKLFGEPTGLGALLVRSDLARLLNGQGGRYFGGGSVASVLAGEDYHVPKPSVAAAMSGGTPHYRGALSVPAGFAALQRLGGMATIEAHVAALAGELVQRLLALRHANGQPAVTIYGARSAFAQARDATSAGRDLGAVCAPQAGPIVAFNVHRQDGSTIGYAEVLKLAALHTPPIQLRGGCCCNPGGCQAALGLSSDDVRGAAASGKQCGDDFDLLSDGRPTGVVRASLGKDSLWEDVDALLSFLSATFVAEIDVAPDVRPLHPPECVTTRLGALYVYPIKSCAAFNAKCWWMDATSGRLLFDREWAMVDGRGEVMRLTAYPKLALIRPAIDLDAETLTLQMEGMPPHIVPLLGDGTGTYLTTGGEGGERISVCTRDCDVHEFGGAATTQWLSKALGVRCRMVRHREPRGDASGVAFANEAPMLLVAQSAVDHLNAALRASGEPPVSTRHFRPNIVLADSGSRAMGQVHLSWDRVELANGAATLRVTGPCSRCSMVEIDPTSGHRHGAVMRALAKHHRVGARLLFGFFCSLDRGGPAPSEVRGKHPSLLELSEGSTMTFFASHDDRSSISRVGARERECAR